MKRILLATGIIAIVSVACKQQQAATATSGSNSSQPSATVSTSTSSTSTSGVDTLYFLETTVSTSTSSTSTSTSVTSNENTTTVNAGSGDNTTTVSAGESTGNTTSTTVSADSSNLYRVTVSFSSRGEGIDYKTAETLENWLKDYPKHPAYVKTHYGREGETCYCLKLNELSTREQEVFVRDLRTLLTDKPLIFIAEYAPCKGKPE